MLAILVLHAGEVVSLDRLIDLLWGEAPPNAATGSLQAYVSNLRRVLEPGRRPREPAQLLVTEAPGYRLRIDRDAVDAFRFVRLADEGRALCAGGDARDAVERLDEAIGLWRGEALAEFRYEGFAAVEIARLEERLVTAEEDRVDALVAAGDHATAISALDVLVAKNPLRERLRALQMVALYRAGRQAEALRAYDDARRRLADELGLVPGPELQRLFAQILDQSPDLLAPIPATPAPGVGNIVVSSPEPGTSDAGPMTAGARFVGRTPELQRIDAAFAEAVQGRCRIVLIGGEPGIGKTRLVEEATAAASGVQVAWGRCHDDDGFPALWPWVQVVRVLQDSRVTGGMVGDVSLADLLDTGNGEPAHSELAQYQLHEAVRRFLEAKSEQVPVVIVLDDLQWADAATLRLLRFLAVELDGARVLLLGTFHEPDTAHDSPLTATLADLARRPHVDRLSLGGLGVDDVADLVRSGTSVDVDAVGNVATELHRRTDGNPFFLTELVRLLESEHGFEPTPPRTDVPLAVRDVVNRRIGRLPDDVQAVLRVAAVVGREFTLDVLHRAAGLDADDAFENLEAAVMARVVLEPESDCYRFSHGLVRETLYSDLTPGRRARLHAKVGRAMEVVFADAIAPHASQLAHHFGAAGEFDPGARYAVLAAEQAERSFAFDAAIGHWNAAIHARDAGGGPDAAVDRARLLLRLAAAHRGAGGVASSADIHDRALEAAERSGDLSLLAEAALAYGEVGLWQVRPYGTVDERVVAAISHVLDSPIGDDRRLRARLLTGLAVALYYRESERERGRALVRDAAAVARQAGEPELLVASLVELVVMLEAEVDQAEQRAVARELERLLDAALPFELETAARMRLARLRLSWGDTHNLERDIDDIADRAVAEHQPIVQLWITWARTAVSFLAGRMDEAELRATSAFGFHDELGIWGGPETYALHMTLIWREQGRLGEVGPGIEPLLEAAQHPGARKLLALFALERGDVDGIETILGPDPVPAVRDFTWLSEMCVTAELCAAARLECAQELYDVMSPLAGRVVTMDGTYVCFGATSHYLGLLAAALGRDAEALAHLEAGLALHDQIRAVPWSVRSRFHLATLLDEGSDRRARLLEEARNASDAHGLVAMRRRLASL